MALLKQQAYAQLDLNKPIRITGEFGTEFIFDEILIDHYGNGGEEIFPLGIQLQNSKTKDEDIPYALTTNVTYGMLPNPFEECWIERGKTNDKLVDELIKMGIIEPIEVITRDYFGTIYQGYQVNVKLYKNE